MKISTIILIFCLCFFLKASVVSAKVTLAEGVTLEAEFRPRFEFDNRDFSDGTGFDAYGTMRTRVGLGIDNLIEDTNLYLMIGDSRMLGYTNPYLTGTSPGPNGFDNNLGVNKAYIEVNNIWKAGTGLKIGRMSNDQGRGLIFGPGNWNLFGPRTYDGVKIRYKANDYSINIWSFYGANGDRHWYPKSDDPSRSPDVASDYKLDHLLNGIDLSLMSRTVNILLFQDLDQARVVDTLKNKQNVATNRTTAAINFAWESKISNHKIDFDLGYQFGSMAHSKGNGEISAYMIAGDYLYNLSNRTLWVGFGFEVFSGDSRTDPEKVGFFYDNYSSKHKTFGFMDYFKNPANLKSKGMRDFIIHAGLSPLKDLKCAFNFHHFSLKQTYISEKNDKPSHNLGFEIDSQLQYTIRKGLTGELGIDLFIPDENWKFNPGDISTLIYLVLSASV